MNLWKKSQTSAEKGGHTHLGSTRDALRLAHLQLLSQGPLFLRKLLLILLLLLRGEETPLTGRRRNETAKNRPQVPPMAQDKPTNEARLAGGRSGGGWGGSGTGGAGPLFFQAESSSEPLSRVMSRQRNHITFSS